MSTQVINLPFTLPIVQPNLPPGPTPISQIKAGNLDALQDMCNQYNLQYLAKTNGQIQAFRNSSTGGNIPTTPMPTSMLWKVLDLNLASELFDKLQAAEQQQQDNPTQYDETKAILTITVPITSNVVSVANGPSNIPVFTYVFTPVKPIITDPVGDDSGDGIHYLTVPGETNLTNGAVFTDSRGTFVKHIMRSVVGTSAWWEKIA